MNVKLLLIITLVFFAAWKEGADDFLLFCAVFAACLSVCVVIYRMENSRSAVGRDLR